MSNGSGFVPPIRSHHTRKNVMQIWVVGQWKDGKPAWDFVGVFSTREKAVDACTDASFFVGPAMLDERAADESKEWPGCFYPLG